jgi:hypothetical protein
MMPIKELINQNKYLVAQPARAPDGSTGGEKSRRQSRFPRLMVNKQSVYNWKWWYLTAKEQTGIRLGAGNAHCVGRVSH